LDERFVEADERLIESDERLKTLFRTLSKNLGSPLDQKLPENRTVAAVLVLAVTTDREVRLVREGREQVQHPRGLRLRHLGPVLPLEALPFPRRLRPLRFFDQLGARSQIREPHIVPVLGRVTLLRDPSRRPAHGPNAQAFTFHPFAAQSYDTNAH